MTTMQGQTLSLGGNQAPTLKGLVAVPAPSAPTAPQARPAALPPASAPTRDSTASPPRPADAPPRARPRIVFVVMSAVAQASTVDQLAHALAPHVVLVHHDFSQTPHFPLTAPNVRFVPNPVRTGWARFGFVEAIFHALAHALEHLDFDYLQLLSPSCLPIQPMAQFERHVSGLEEAHFDCVDLQGDEDALMSVGYRAWTANGSLMHRLMRRAADVYFGNSPGRRDEAGIWLRTGAGMSLGSQLAGLALRSLQLPWVGRHLRGQPLRLYYGSTWFGARRHIVAGLVRHWRQPGLRRHFERVCIAEEFLVPSLLMQLRPHKGRLNHLIQRFDQAHPGCFTQASLAQLGQAQAFFARKFPDDAQAPVRLQVLAELAAAPLAAPSGSHAVASASTSTPLALQAA